MSLPLHHRNMPSPQRCTPTRALTPIFILILGAAPLYGQSSRESQPKLGKTSGKLSSLSGKAHVVDARTLKIDGKNIRLKWIEPLPIYTQTMRYPLKQPAVEALKSRIDFETVTCAVEVHKRLDLFRPRESYSGTCYLGDSTSGLDLNGWLVRHGWARVNRLGSVTRYVQEETKARAERAGAWSSVGKTGWCCKGVDSERKYRRKSPSGLD